MAAAILAAGATGFERAASAIQAVCADHDIVAEGEPRIQPETVDDTEIADHLIIDAIDRGRTRGLAEFDTKRAANTTYDDMVFFERQAFLTLADAGTTTTTASATRRFERATDRDKTPHGDTHLETMKTDRAAARANAARRLRGRPAAGRLDSNSR